MLFFSNPDSGGGEMSKKEWTLMFYFASDNPLAAGIVSQLKSIKQAGFHPEINVIAQFDPQAEGAPTHIFEVNLKDVRGLADERLVDPLLARLAQEARALLLVGVDEDRVGVGALQLHHVGGEVHLP